MTEENYSDQLRNYKIDEILLNNIIFPNGTYEILSNTKKIIIKKEGKYTCNLCDFSTWYNSNMEKHLLTKKHKKRELLDNIEKYTGKL